LQADANKISGTIPILRYLAKCFHFEPNTEIEQAKADMYGEVIQNLTEKLRPITHAAFGMKNDERAVR